MRSNDYQRGYNAGYRAGLRHREGKAVPSLIAPPRPKVDHEPWLTYQYMLRHCPERGGYMFEGARPAYESGKYKDAVIDELLRLGWIVPHADPTKGWVPVPRDTS